MGVELAFIIFVMRYVVDEFWVKMFSLSKNRYIKYRTSHRSTEFHVSTRVKRSTFSCQECPPLSFKSVQKQKTPLWYVLAPQWNNVKRSHHDTDVKDMKEGGVGEITERSHRHFYLTANNWSCIDRWDIGASQLILSILRSSSWRCHSFTLRYPNVIMSAVYPAVLILK